jgi:peptidoglycan hydrolase-like protein with peptidoglycan-binding domain
MRCLLPALALLMLLPAAHAQTAKKAATKAEATKAEKSAKAATGPTKGAYGAMTEAERNALQSDLIWSGDYNGVVGAEFGDRAVAAIKAYQKRNGAKDTGILTPDERAKLAQAAKARQEQVGWRLVEDAGTGARLGIPTKLAPQSGQGKAGSRWQSGHGEVQIETFRVNVPGTTLASVFEQQRKEPAERKVEYNVLRPDFFVLSGLQGLKKFYVRAQFKENPEGPAKGSDVRGLTILYDQAMEGTMDRIAVAMSSTFAAFPAQLAGAPAPRRKVEYGTGLIVSSAGDIVTDAELLAGCEFIGVPPFGYAERIAEEGSLALLRVNGARDLAPVALGAAGGGAGTPGAEVTLIGIADPQSQNGGNAVSAARGRVVGAGGNAAIEPAPGSGFAGAAMIDRDGNLAGIVGLHSQPASAPTGAQAAPSGGIQAAIVPAPAISKFLQTQSIQAATGHAGIEAVKTATVRLICVRK